MGLEKWGEWVTEETVMPMFVLFVVTWIFGVFILPYFEQWLKDKELNMGA